MEAGEVASASAVREWIHALAEADLIDPLAQNQAVLDAVRRANQAVRTALEDRRGGCTFTGVVLVGRRLALAHVGDSRAYLAHASGALEALSRDHSLVASLVAVGALTPEEAIGHPDRNKILRCLGMADAEEDGYIDDLSSVGGDPSAATRELNPGDVILLVSDGVWGELIDSELSEAIARHRFDPQRLVDELVERAVAASGQDNATAVAVTVAAA
jgi:protein phosphatase